MILNIKITSTNFFLVIYLARQQYLNRQTIASSSMSMKPTIPHIIS